MTKRRNFVILASTAVGAVALMSTGLFSTTVRSAFGAQSILPSEWDPLASDSVTIAYAGRDFTINGSKPWSFTSPDDNILRFEVRKGDRFSSLTYTDAVGVERSEIGDVARYPVSDDVSIEYSFMVEPGPKNTARWLTMGQLHSGMNMSPPVEIKLNGDDKIKISGNSGLGDINSAVYKDLYQDEADLKRGHWYKLKMNITLGPAEKGRAQIWRDGVKIVDYKGPLGYTNQKVSYWKQGVYRSTAPETMAVDFKDLVIKTGRGAID